MCYKEKFYKNGCGGNEIYFPYLFIYFFKYSQAFLHYGSAFNLLPNIILYRYLSMYIL